VVELFSITVCLFLWLSWCEPLCEPMALRGGLDKIYVDDVEV